MKLEANTIINDANSNTQQSQSLKEVIGKIQQSDSSLYQKLNEFLGTSSNQLNAGDFIVPNGPEIKDLGEIKLK